MARLTFFGFIIEDGQNKELKWQKQKMVFEQKLAVPTDVAAMIAILLVAVTAAVATIAKTVVIRL